MRKFTMAMIQMDVVEGKENNLITAEKLIREAAIHAKVIVLPEMFNCPYHAKLFKVYGETYPGITTDVLSTLAGELGVCIVGGSIPEIEGDNIYNTSYIFASDGQLIGKHRKTHLFDVDIKGKISFRESDIVTSGDQTTVVETEFCKIGVAICYDVRFPDFMRKMAMDGAKVIVVPAAFNTTTGPAHWELLTKLRAVDNQVYFAMISPARTKTLKYKAYGHTMMADPWGKVIANSDVDQCIVYGEIDLDYLDKIRQELPLLDHRKPDTYE